METHMPLEGEDDQIEKNRVHTLEALLDDMVTILILNTGQDVPLQLSNDLSLHWFIHITSVMHI